jgi:hypothetical protein
MQSDGINSSHSFLGISMLAIAATIYATCVLTRDSGDPKVFSICCFICCLNCASQLIQKFSYY